MFTGYPVNLMASHFNSMESPRSQLAHTDVHRRQESYSESLIEIVEEWVFIIFPDDTAINIYFRSVIVGPLVSTTLEITVIS